MNAAFWIGFTAYVVLFVAVVYSVTTVAQRAGAAAADLILRWFSIPAGLAGLLAFTLAIYLDANPHGATACLVVAVFIVNMLRTHKAPNVS